MWTRAAVLAVVVYIATLSPIGQQSPSQPSIQGVWRIVEEHAGGRTITNPNPGFIIFTAKHYAGIRVAQDIKRPTVDDLDTATAEQLLAVWGPFVAQFGTYEIKGDQLMQQVLVAKDPRNMGQRGVRRFKIEGNTLSTWAAIDPSGDPLSKPNELKWTRVE